MQNDTCYILALFKRDDGERLLLGSGYYAFANTQKHFNPNTFSNDVVELQGTDGQLLAGQVRRSTSQSFDGFVGNGTTPRSIVEQKRREFFLFFRKQHHYTVVYIMPDGTTIKRDRGYITDAPAVQELYQVQPKYHVALAFEDVNYYSYAEDAQGNEIYSFSATLALANIEDGGLIWDANGAKSDAYAMTTRNLFDKRTIVAGDIQGANKTIRISTRQILWLEAGTYTFSTNLPTPTRFSIGVDSQTFPPYSQWPTWEYTSGWQDTDRTVTFTLSQGGYFTIQFSKTNNATITLDEVIPYDFQLEAGNESHPFEPYGPGQSTGGYIFAASTGGGPVTVTVNGVDSANPVWHVLGPATNPTLTNSTTGEALVWNGTVPSGQELIIDMGAQTATMEGANVFEFVSGSWVHLAPGANRISYTAANTTTPSTVYWNEVVG